MKRTRASGAGSGGPGRRSIVLVLALAAAGMHGCRKAPTELAPVKAGDTFLYKIVTGAGPTESSYLTTLTLTEVDADHFRLDSNPSANSQPEVVDRALQGDKLLKMHYLRQLWLPPSERVQGARSRVGTITGARKWPPFDVWIAEETGHDQYFFDKNTGFLVGYVVSLGGTSGRAYLVKSSVAGLPQ